MTEAIAAIEAPETPKPLNDDSVSVDEYVRRRMDGESGIPETSEAPKEEEAKKSAAEEPAQPPKGSEEGKSKDETKTEKSDTPAWVQKRIDALTAKRKEAEDRAEALQAELDKAKRADKPADESDPEPTPEKFKTYEEYVKAQARWETRQELREQSEKANQEAESARLKEVFNAHNSRIAAAQAKFADFDEVMASSKTTFSRDAGLAIFELENGPEVMYHLASHPEELEALGKLTPIRQITKLGQISASLLPSESVDTAPKPKPTTKAPEPITPVTATSSSKKPLNDDSISMDEYYRRRMADKNKSRR